jgi:hypothetical protein
MADPTYVAWWFRRYGFYAMDRPFFLKENARRVAEQDGAHPGFSQSLRVFALDALTSGEEATVRQALSALAVVGEVGDIPAIRSASSRGGPAVTKDASTAVYEIEHRAQAA